MAAHLGLLLETFGPVARQGNKALRNFHVRSFGPVVMEGKSRLYNVAASVNGMVVLLGKDNVAAAKK